MKRIVWVVEATGRRVGSWEGDGPEPVPDAGTIGIELSAEDQWPARGNRWNGESFETVTWTSLTEWTPI